jgi:hypothetical protein
VLNVTDELNVSDSNWIFFIVTVDRSRNEMPPMTARSYINRYDIIQVIKMTGLQLITILQEV